MDLALLTALIVLAAAIVGFLAKLRSDVDEIHVIVNSHAKVQANRIDQLVEVLVAAGLEVPEHLTDGTPTG